MTEHRSDLARRVALLRAINVGSHQVKMDRLRGLFEALGFERVETLIASGNVIFSAPEGDDAALERAIERHLEAALGYEVATFLRRGEAMRAAAESAPFSAEEGGTLYVGFLGAAPGEAARAKTLALATPTDLLAFANCELYWLCRTSMHQSKVSGAALEKALGMPLTLRNINTVRRLAEKIAGG